MYGLISYAGQCAPFSHRLQTVRPSDSKIRKEILEDTITIN
jgi:hypothetical protein